MKYVIRTKRNPQNGKIKYHIQVAPVSQVDLTAIAARIERTSTVSSADIKAVLDALQYEVLDYLKNGNSVHLGDLGSFRPTIQSKGAEKLEDVKVSDIRRVRVQFMPSAGMKKAFTPAFIKFEKYQNVSDASSDEDMSPEA